MCCFTGKKPLDFISRDAAAVITHPDTAEIFFGGKIDCKPSGLSAAAAQPVFNGVLYNGLKYQAGDGQLQEFFLQMILCQEGMVCKNKLNGNVSLYVFQFIPYGSDILSVIQGGPVKKRVRSCTVSLISVCSAIMARALIRESVL